MEELSDFQTGRIKWYAVAKNFGFIRSDEGEEIFLHHSAIVYDGAGHCEHLRGMCVRALSLLHHEDQAAAMHEFSTPKFERLLIDASVRFRVIQAPRGPEARAVKRLEKR